MHQQEASGQESYLRSAASRAYYAAFCHARNWAREKTGFQPSGKSEDHSNLREHFRRIEMTDVASRLDHLRKWRNSADYSDYVSNPKRLARSATKYAAEILKQL